MNKKDSKNALEFFKKRRDRKINGIHTNFVNLKQVLPAWDIASTTILAGRSGDGKTSFIWQHAVVDVINFLQKNPDTTAHIFFFSLELQYTELFQKVFSTLLFNKFKKVYPRDVFMAVSEERLSDEEIRYIEEECKPFLDLLNKNVTIIDTDMDKILNPTGVLIEAVTLVEECDAEYKFVIIDTVNAIAPESGSNKQEAMKTWNQEFALKELRNKRNCIVINIMQLDMESGKRQFDKNANSVIEKYLPTLESIGNDKEAGRSASLVLSLFNPLKFNITVLNNYNVTAFQGTLRFMYVLKNNFGVDVASYPFVFHGASNTWIEIVHSPEEFRANPKLYENYGISEPKKTSLGDSIVKKYSTLRLEE